MVNNKEWEIIQNWEPLSKMENASKELYLERVRLAYQVRLPNQNITLIPYIGLDEKVTYHSDELISLCPVTFLPDLNTLDIIYIPGNWVPELKALKYYLLDYSKLPISHEHLASRIARDLVHHLAPKAFKVTLKVAIRGGITTFIEVGDKI